MVGLDLKCPLNGLLFELDFKSNDESTDESVKRSFVICGLIGNDHVLCISEQDSCHVVYPLTVIIGKPLMTE